MRIFCPATLSYLTIKGFRALGAENSVFVRSAERVSPHDSALAMPPLFTCLWFTDPRARVCRPYAHSFA